MHKSFFLNPTKNYENSTSGLFLNDFFCNLTPRSKIHKIDFVVFFFNPLIAKLKFVNNVQKKIPLLWEGNQMVLFSHIKHLITHNGLNCLHCLSLKMTE